MEQPHLINGLLRRADSGYVDPNFPNPNGPNDTSIIIYGYTPSIVLAAFAATWFAVFFVVHLTQTIRLRAWWYIPFPVGLVFEVVGYVARSLSSKKDPYNLIDFVLNYFFIVTAPVFLAAAVYAVLSALIPRLGRQYSFLPPKTILWFFILSDVIATILQVAGAALVGVAESDHKSPTTANDILLGGLAYQVFSMGVFVILVSTFMFRARQAIHQHNLVVFIAAFFASTVAIYLRTCFRLAETAQGIFGQLSTHEGYFGGLEFAPVAFAVLLLGIWHPARYVGNKVRVVDKEAGV